LARDDGEEGKQERPDDCSLMKCPICNKDINKKTHTHKVGKYVVNYTHGWLRPYPDLSLTEVWLNDSPVWEYCALVFLDVERIEKLLLLK
jgi:hypothetical protein